MSPSAPSSNNAPASDQAHPAPKAWWRRWVLTPLLTLLGLGFAGALSVLLLVAIGLCVAYPNLP